MRDSDMQPGDRFSLYQDPTDERTLSYELYDENSQHT